MRTFALCIVLAVMWGVHHGAVDAAEPQVTVSVSVQNATTGHQTMEDGRLLVSVHDARNDPIHGLKEEDFTVYEKGKRARILAVEPLQTSQEVPLNIVFVLDNSASMKRRKAIESLFSAFDAFLRTIRPIDNIHIVVFAQTPGVHIGGTPLRVETFSSNNPSELKGFLREAFDLELTDKTVLYEAMLAGTDVIRNMPTDTHKFLAVFSDGEDINSVVERSRVESYARQIPNFEVFAIDHMPGPGTDPFLKRFAENHGGRIWKATSAGQLLAIFESFSTSLLHRYVVSYEILDPPRGSLLLSPAEINLDILTLTDGSPIGDFLFFEHGSSEIPGTYVLFPDEAGTNTFQEDHLTSAMDRYLNVLNLVGRRLRTDPTLNVRIVGCNSNVALEEGDLGLSNRRAERVRRYLETVWGIQRQRMTVQGRNLPARPSPGEVLGGRAENQRVEIVYDSKQMQLRAPEKYIWEKSGITRLKVRPQITAEYGVARWQAELFSGQEVLKQLGGTNGLEAAYSVPLADLGKLRLTGMDDIGCRIQVTDTQGDTFETRAPVCRIHTSKIQVIHSFVPPPGGMIAVQPDSVTIEEITTIDTSPLLNYIFFETGESAIPDRYIRLSGQEATQAFSADHLRGTLKKYHHLLNVVGKRLRAQPAATVSLVGCTSSHRPEKGNELLARLRAESVKSYLQYVWGIAPGRMVVSARGLPAAPSTTRTPAGRAENQRVEIHSEASAILDPVESEYLEERSETQAIEVLPRIHSGYGIAGWEIGLFGAEERLAVHSGRQGLNNVHSFALQPLGIGSLTSYDHLTIRLDTKDRKGQEFTTTSRCSIDFVKRKERIAQKIGYTVVEKYALILFDFDSATVEDRNRQLVERIIQRAEEHPSANIRVIGHTDNIGKAEYNLALSARRAETVYAQLLEGDRIDKERVSHQGVGPNDPLYDNDLPEGRALNRTVTVYLEYEDRD